MLTQSICWPFENFKNISAVNKNDFIMIFVKIHCTNINITFTLPKFEIMKIILLRQVFEQQKTCT